MSVARIFELAASGRITVAEAAKLLDEVMLEAERPGWVPRRVWRALYDLLAPQEPLLHDRIGRDPGRARAARTVKVRRDPAAPMTDEERERLHDAIDDWCDMGSHEP